MRSMFVVAWGDRAVELLMHHDPTAERADPLAVSGAYGATDGPWRCWISGRLTNASELAKRLGLPANADPAALVARAFARLGPDACKHLRGTFVVVAFDRAHRSVQVVRDQLGGRPLVHARVGDGVLLAEHERAIVDLLPSVPGPDRLTLAQWIESGTIPAGRTLFDGIGRVAPAHREILSADGVTTQCWWRPRYEGVVAGSPAGLAERFRDAAFEAVARGAQEARTPAVLLSGGLDSSCVAAGLAARTAAGSPQAMALSGVFPSHPDTDERELIEATADHTGLPVELIAFEQSSSIVEPAMEHIERWSLPPATPNLFLWRPVMARARELGVDAMLDGEGGDELFGFAPHLIADMLSKGRVLAAWRLTNQIPGIGDEATMRVRLRALRLYGVSRLVPAPIKRRRKATSAGSPSSLLQDGDARALRELDLDERPVVLDGPLWWRELAGQLTHPGEMFAASAHFRRNADDEGIDRRHPFLFDVDLVARALANPPRMQFDVRDRVLLREGLCGHIPEAVRTRHEKSYFNGMLATGLAGDGALLAEGPAQSDAPVRAFVRPDPLAALLQEGPAPAGARAASRLWRVGLADAWLRTLDRPGHARELLERSCSRV